MLAITGRAVTDVGISRLSKLGNLRVLGLCMTGLTDAGLQHLGNLQNLEELDIWGTHVTDASIDRLQALQTPVSPLGFRDGVQLGWN